jgi:hypothetical protein
MNIFTGSLNQNTECVNQLKKPYVPVIGHNRSILRNNEINVKVDSTSTYTWKLKLEKDSKIRNIWLRTKYSVSAANLFLDTEFIGANPIERYIVKIGNQDVINLDGNTLDSLIGTMPEDEFNYITKGCNSGITNGTTYTTWIPLILPWINPSRYTAVHIPEHVKIEVIVTFKYITYAHNDADTDPTATDGVDANESVLYYEQIMFPDESMLSVYPLVEECYSYHTLIEYETYTAASGASDSIALSYKLEQRPTNLMFFFIKYHGELTDTTSDIGLVNLLTSIDDISIQLGSRSVVTSEKMYDTQMLLSEGPNTLNHLNDNSLTNRVLVINLFDFYDVKQNLCEPTIEENQLGQNLKINFTLTLKNTANVVEAYDFYLVQSEPNVMISNDTLVNYVVTNLF